MWYIYTIYSALKRREILIDGTTWINLEGIMLSEISHQRRTNNVWFHVYIIPRIVRLIKSENRTVVAKVWRQREIRNYCLMDVKFHYDKMKIFWRWRVVMVAQQGKKHLSPLNCTPQMAEVVTFVLCLFIIIKKNRRKRRKL